MTPSVHNAMRKYLPVLLLTCAVIGCGYRLERRQDVNYVGGAFTKADAIAIPLLRNATIQPDLEKIVTEALITRLQGSGMNVTGKSSARLILSGKLTDYNPRNALSYNKFQQIQEYRLVITAQFSLLDVQSGNTVWQSGSLSASAEYLLGQDAIATLDAERSAQRVAADRLAQSILGQWEAF